MIATKPKPGSFFITSLPGVSGKAIWLGQLLAGRPSKYEHAGIVLSEDGTIVQAEAGGASLGNLSQYKDQSLLISDAPVQQWMAKTRWIVASRPHQIDWAKTEAGFRLNVVTEARKLVGVPYSALDYLALAALHLHLPSYWIRERVESSGHLICSALVDRIYMNAGIHLFDDGRLPGDVMPSDLAWWVRQHPQPR